MATSTEEVNGPQRVAVIICAHDVGHDVATTVRSCRAIPGVDLIVVIDDGSEDDTAHQARMAGAVVVRHSVHRGRASARETGVKVAAMRDRADWPARLLLFLSADLGESAVDASALVEAVRMGEADCAVARPASLGEAPVKRCAAERLALRALRHTSARDLTSPLAEERCFTRDALNAAMPFSTGHGLEIGMLLDMTAAGFTVTEVPCDFHHSGADRSIGEVNRKQRWVEVALAVLTHARTMWRNTWADRRAGGRADADPTHRDLGVRPGVVGADSPGAGGR